jgi:tRNA dimethylallyltransferase
MQVYRTMDVGTAKPRAELLERMPHHLIDIVDPDRQFDVGEFVRRADSLSAEISARGKLPVVAGGTAFYLKSFACGLPGTPPRSPALRRELQKELEIRGLPSLYSELSRIDPSYARSISSSDPARVIRALEVYRLSGRMLSSYRLPKALRDAYRFLLIGLKRSREDLHERIDRRVEGMFAAGLREEVKSLLGRGYGWGDPGMKGIGYREFHGMQLGHLTLFGVKEQIKRNTKSYAKRQITFFRALPAAQWFHAQEFGQAVEAIESWRDERST